MAALNPNQERYSKFQETKSKDIGVFQETTVLIQECFRLVWFTTENTFSRTTCRVKKIG